MRSEGFSFNSAGLGVEPSIPSCFLFFPGVLGESRGSQAVLVRESGAFGVGGTSKERPSCSGGPGSLAGISSSREDREKAEGGCHGRC